MLCIALFIHCIALYIESYLPDGMLERVAEHPQLLHNNHHVEHRVPISILIV
jgi:hypothetical protein